MTYQQAVDFINDQRVNGKNPKDASESLVKDSIDRGTLDNVTVIVVYLAPSSQSKPNKQQKDPDEEEEEEMDIYGYLKSEADKNKEKEIKEKFQDFDIPSDESVIAGLYLGARRINYIATNPNFTF